MGSIPAGGARPKKALKERTPKGVLFFWRKAFGCAKCRRLRAGRPLRSMCGRNLRFPHTRPLPSFGWGSCTPLQELTFALHANQGPSGRICGGGGSYPSPAPGGPSQPTHAPGQCPVPISRPWALSMPGPFTRDDGLHPASGTIIRHTRRTDLYFRNYHSHCAQNKPPLSASA